MPQPTSRRRMTTPQTDDPKLSANPCAARLSAGAPDRQVKIMLLSPKDIHCPCGHTTTLRTPKLRCVKCGKYIFYDASEQKRHKMNTVYVITMLALAAGVVTYLFIEMVAAPLLGN